MDTIIPTSVTGLVNLPRFLFLIGITLAVSATAQTPIPTFLQAERAIGVPATMDNRFPGSSSVAGNGKDFLVVTAEDLLSGYSHALMLVDSAGHPLLVSSDAFNFGAGNSDGVASNGHDFLVESGGLRGTIGVRSEE